MAQCPNASSVGMTSRSCVAISNQISSLDSCKKSVQDESPNPSKHLNLHKLQHFTNLDPQKKQKVKKQLVNPSYHLHL